MLHYHGVQVGNLNHSKGTIKKIKDVIAKVLRSKVKAVLAAPLPSTGLPRPVSELFDKMTYVHKTGQMQMIVAPILNDRELFSAIYLENYLVDPNKNRYQDMVTMVREVGSQYYADSQVENGAADGAYAKSDKTKKYYTNSLDLNSENEWVELQ